MQIKVRENKKAINNLDWDGGGSALWRIISEKRKKGDPTTLNTPNYLRLFISNSSQHHQQQAAILHFTYFIIYERQR